MAVVLFNSPFHPVTGGITVEAELEADPFFFFHQGRRNGFVIGGGGGKQNFAQNFWELNFHIERIPFCTLVNM